MELSWRISLCGYNAKYMYHMSEEFPQRRSREAARNCRPRGWQHSSGPEQLRPHKVFGGWATVQWAVCLLRALYASAYCQVVVWFLCSSLRSVLESPFRVRVGVGEHPNPYNIRFSFFRESRPEEPLMLKALIGKQQPLAPEVQFCLFAAGIGATWVWAGVHELL